MVKKYEDIKGLSDVPLYYEKDVLHKMKSRDYSMITTYVREHNIQMIEM